MEPSVGSSSEARPAAPTQPPPRAGAPSPVPSYLQIAALADILALAAAGFFWRLTEPTRAVFTPLEASLMALALVAFGAVALRQFSPIRLAQILHTPWTTSEALLVPALVGGAATLLAFLALGEAAAGAVLLWPALAAALLLPTRILVSAVARQGVQAGWLRRRIAVIGAGEVSDGLIRRLTAPGNKERPDIIGIFDDRDATRRPEAVAGVAVVGTVRDLTERAAEERIDIIVIALPIRRALDILRSIQQVQWLSSDVLVLLGGENEAPQGAPVSLIAGQPALRLVRQPIPAGGMLAKTAMDYALAAVAGLLLLPVLALAALAIRLDSPGPVLFTQTRVGRFGRPFRIFKLRTLTWDPTDDGRVGVKGTDRRITRVGRFLRATCIDEMPQVFNVLRGEMSFVGPRPHVPRMEVRGVPIEEALPGYGARHRLKPGITGWAQVNGLSGTIEEMGMAREVLAHDLAYVAEWSLWLDLRIIARTAAILMLGRDAFEARRHEWRSV
ncbi:exopolysaccharide biosynthesis polyprenyl glycosylphosphotransferase [Rubritepida flocculans]|uniref:exopolysaccharide biosynthesis polyprenyl glycosylphosphotransferase n=1 Tax=Rubritepida flocculans TaxID=182403 RepID=UPI0004023AD8|nr:exopolysaccharide biosynthesis polyprenyl glycosylphosphotransferase [Rubritepida flocculans]